MTESPLQILFWAAMMAAGAVATAFYAASKQDRLVDDWRRRSFGLWVVATAVYFVVFWMTGQ